LINPNAAPMKRLSALKKRQFNNSLVAIDNVVIFTTDGITTDATLVNAATPTKAIIPIATAAAATIMQKTGIENIPKTSNAEIILETLLLVGATYTI
jgi:hypothetical protein